MQQNPRKLADRNRRQFLQQGGSCCAYVAGLAALAPVMTRRVFAVQDARPIVAKEKWCRLEKIHDNVWALISTIDAEDQQTFVTVCNGGIVAGSERVLTIDAFMNSNGAAWLAERAKELTGRWPTDVVVTHFHADHVAGISGYSTQDQSPQILVTKTTKRLVEESRGSDVQEEALKNVSFLETDRASELDLGGRKVSIVPRAGHTPSDVTIELADPSIVFCGDLVFHRMIPNYRDSKPRQLNADVAALIREKDTLYVPGHGPAAGNAELKTYQQLLGIVEQAASAAYEAGTAADAAAAGFQLPEAFRDWYIFSPQVIPAAFSAWYREFEADK